MQKAKATRISESSSFISLHLNAETSACSLYTDGEFHAIGVSLFFIFLNIQILRPMRQRLSTNFSPFSICFLYFILFFFFLYSFEVAHNTAEQSVDRMCASVGLTRQNYRRYQNPSIFYMVQHNTLHSAVMVSSCYEALSSCGLSLRFGVR